jgi:hypothetical protein
MLLPYEGRGLNGRVKGTPSEFGKGFSDEDLDKRDRDVDQRPPKR